jgi:hypothetical protein
VSILGRIYLDPGDRLSGRHAPPRPCRILTQWAPDGGPRNVAVEYLADGSRAVIPFPRRLRKAEPDLFGDVHRTHGDRKQVMSLAVSPAPIATSPTEVSTDGP